MKGEIYKIQLLLQEIANGNNWTGVKPIQKILQDIDNAKAIRYINENHLNIAELVAHLSCWNKVITHRLDNENYQPSKEEDFPTINKINDEEWNELKNTFLTSFDILINKLSEKSDDILDKPIFDGGTSAYRNLHGQIAHIHYHLGQIVLLCKIL